MGPELRIELGLVVVRSFSTNLIQSFGMKVANSHLTAIEHSGFERISSKTSARNSSLISLNSSNIVFGEFFEQFSALP